MANAVKPLSDGFFAELVDGIDRVRYRLVCHCRKGFGRHRLASLGDPVSDGSAQRAQKLAKILGNRRAH